MAADPLENDELLLLKKRARRRLVGAVAFMMVALVVLSSVMESRPLPTEQKVVQVAIDGLSSPPASPAPNAFNAPGDDAVLASDAGAAAFVPPARKATGTAEPLPTPQPAAHQPPASRLPPPVITKVEGRTAASPEKKSGVGKDSSKLVVKSAVPPKAGGLSASVIALSDAGKAAELQRKLRAKGLSAYTEQVQVGGKTLTRVRIGPYATRDELDKARAKLALMGL